MENENLEGLIHAYKAQNLEELKKALTLNKEKLLQVYSVNTGEFGEILRPDKAEGKFDTIDDKALKLKQDSLGGTYIPNRVGERNGSVIARVDTIEVPKRFAQTMLTYLERKIIYQNDEAWKLYNEAVEEKVRIAAKTEREKWVPD